MVKIENGPIFGLEVQLGTFQKVFFVIFLVETFQKLIFVDFWVETFQKLIFDDFPAETFQKLISVDFRVKIFQNLIFVNFHVKIFQKFYFFNFWEINSIQVKNLFLNTGKSWKYRSLTFLQKIIIKMRCSLRIISFRRSF